MSRTLVEVPEGFEEQFQEYIRINGFSRKQGLESLLRLVMTHHLMTRRRMRNLPTKADRHDS
jgi:hypothetical protein